MSEMLPIKVQGVVVDPVSRGFAVILRDEATNRWLPIYIGPFEAQAIAFELEKQKLPRPATHDLIKNLLDELGFSAVKVSITDLKDNTYYAVLSIASENDAKDIDCRPSDAIAVALRAKCPVFVSKEVFDKAAMSAYPQEDEKTKQLRELQTRLNECIEQENYEEASRLRDKMNQLKNNP